MNKYSLTFKNKKIEKKFQDQTNTKSLIQCKILTILLIIEDILATLIALINQYYQASGFLFTFLFFNIGFYFLLVKFHKKIKYGILWFDVVSFCSPIALLIFIYFIDVEFMEKICLTIGYMAIHPQFILSQNIFIDSGLYFYGMIMISFACFQLVGFSQFLLIPPLFSISWISSKFQNIKLERIFFSESQTNECLATVLRRICKEKIMIFTYDEMNIKYQEYLINDECKKYFQDRTLNEILSNIFVTCQNQQVSISSYIHRNIISNQNEEEFYSEVFQGYFNEKKNKIYIELYVQTTSKTFFTLKITEIQKENVFCKNKGQRLLHIQNKVLHKILPKYVEIFSKDLQLTTKIQEFYKFMRQQISVLKLYIFFHSKNIEFVIKKFDLIHSISDSFNKENRRFILKLLKDKDMDQEQEQLEEIQEIQKALINSDQFLVGMFIENILMLIRVTISQDSLVNIQLVYSGDYIQIQFSYQSLDQICISDKNYQKLVKSLDKLTELIGIKGSLIIKKSIIHLTLIDLLKIGYN